MKKNIIKNCVIPLLFSFLTILMVFVSGSTAHAAAQKVDSFDFGPKLSLIHI